MKPRILVVDDDPQVLKLFGRILEKGGYAVLLASTGNNLLEMLQREAVDAVVLDLSMPPPDGFDLLRELRMSMPGLRILATSGYMGGAFLKAAAHLGATATLPKVDAPCHLIEAVENLLRKHPRPSSFAHKAS